MMQRYIKRVKFESLKAYLWGWAGWSGGLKWLDSKKKI